MRLARYVKVYPHLDAAVHSPDIQVRIVERKDTGLTFALKYIRKDEGMYWLLSYPGLSSQVYSRQI